MHHRTTDITASKHYIEHFSVTLAGKNKEGATKKPLGRFHHLCFEMKLRKISQWPRIYIYVYMVGWCQNSSHFEIRLFIYSTHVVAHFQVNNTKYNVIFTPTHMLHSNQIDVITRHNNFVPRIKRHHPSAAAFFSSVARK